MKDELKFVRSTEHMPDDWSEYELVAIRDKTDDKGVLLLRPRDEIYVVEYELSRRIVDSQTGRTRAVICDFCFTWQPGSNAASITFIQPRSKRKVTFLCCADLDCSRHVRTLTDASKMSRAQLREYLSNEDRIERLKRKLQEKIDQLELVAV